MCLRQVVSEAGREHRRVTIASRGTLLLLMQLSIKAKWPVSLRASITHNGTRSRACVVAWEGMDGCTAAAGMLVWRHRSWFH